jgi:hypothetical protein
LAAKKDHETEELVIWTNPYLISSHKPLYCCSMEELVRVWDNLLGKLLLLKITIQGMCHLFCSCLPLFDVPGKF